MISNTYVLTDVQGSTLEQIRPKMIPITKATGAGILFICSATLLLLYMAARQLCRLESNVAGQRTSTNQGLGKC